MKFLPYNGKFLSYDCLDVCYEVFISLSRLVTEFHTVLYWVQSFPRSTCFPEEALLSSRNVHCRSEDTQLCLSKKPEETRDMFLHTFGTSHLPAASTVQHKPPDITETLEGN